MSSFLCCTLLNLILLLLPTSGLSPRLQPRSRIVNGIPTTTEIWPFVVSLRLERIVNGISTSDHFCGGSIIRRVENALLYSLFPNAAVNLYPKPLVSLYFAHCIQHQSKPAAILTAAHCIDWLDERQSFLDSGAWSIWYFCAFYLYPRIPQRCRCSICRISH